MNMNKRVRKGISGMILALVALVGAIETTNAQCTVDIMVTQSPSTCFSQVAIASTASDPVQQWSYYLDGQLVGTGSSVLLNLEPGVYQAYVGITTDQGCTATDLTTFIVAGNVLQVDAGADVSVCQEQTVLSASISATNSYSVQWTPASLLENPTAASTLVAQNVTDQWFIVDVIDDVTGCVASDTVIVTQQNPLFDTLDLCSGQALIDLGPGGLYYQWLSWTDTAGNNQSLNIPTTQQSITVNEPGQYFAVANFPQCGGLTSLITVVPCSDCESFFTYNLNYQQCEAFGQFVAGSNTSVVSYLWDFGDGHTSTVSNPFHAFTAGIYTVTLTTTDVNGCVSTSSQQVAVTAGFTATASEDTIACQGAATMSVSTFAGSGNFSYQWTPTQGNFSDPTLSEYTVESVHDQVYYVTVTDL
ncbi:MAG: hypothetical protein RL266_2370, partial [Bacteroidota bacterium]